MFSRVQRVSGVPVFSGESARSYVEPMPGATYALYTHGQDTLYVEQGLLSALSVYPKYVTKEHLNFIVLLSQLTFDTVKYGGTYIVQPPRSTGVYLVVPPQLEGIEITTFVAETFHHEFSSILLKAYPEFAQAWTSEFKYMYSDNKGGFLALKNNNFKEASVSELNEQGILSYYGASSLEEDFNTFAENILSHPKEFKMRYSKFPLIKQKAKTFINLYLKISPAFKHSEAFLVLEDWD